MIRIRGGFAEGGDGVCCPVADMMGGSGLGGGPLVVLCSFLWAVERVFERASNLDCARGGGWSNCRCLGRGGGREGLEIYFFSAVREPY